MVSKIDDEKQPDCFFVLFCFVCLQLASVREE